MKFFASLMVVIFGLMYYLVGDVYICWTIYLENSKESLLLLMLLAGSLTDRQLVGCEI